MVHRAILIAGPTASGKSALALEMARDLGGEIVNADSMQVYRELRIISARPSPQDEALAPHHLYGVLSAREVCSAGRWLAMLEPLLEEIWSRGRPAIIVGGTGLYFRAALNGLAPTPAIPGAVKAEGRAILDERGSEGLHDALTALDPEMAARLNPGDPQRLTRAWEVMRATGRSLADWQAEAAPSLFGPLEAKGELRKLALMPDRQRVYDRIDRRFERMVAEGGLAEARTLAGMGLGAGHPVMKALGLPSLIAHVRGEMPLEAAITDAQTQSRRYAKRQMTWIRHQFADWEAVVAQYMERFLYEFRLFIPIMGLTT
jgi:tRNA dimethylallyltransferase